MLTVSVYRYNPEIDYEPYMQDFSFDDEGKDMMVLDVLEKLKVIEEEWVKNNFKIKKYQIQEIIRLYSN